METSLIKVASILGLQEALNTDITAKASADKVLVGARVCWGYDEYGGPTQFVSLAYQPDAGLPTQPVGLAKVLNNPSNLTLNAVVSKFAQAVELVRPGLGVLGAPEIVRLNSGDDMDDRAVVACGYSAEKRAALAEKRINTYGTQPSIADGTTLNTTVYQLTIDLANKPFVFGGVPYLVGSSLTDTDILAHSKAWIRPTRASITDQLLTYKIREYGTAGNDWTLEIVEPSGTGTFSVVVDTDAKSIVVNLARSGGAVTTTLAHIYAAFTDPTSNLFSPDAAVIVEVTADAMIDLTDTAAALAETSFANAVDPATPAAVANGKAVVAALCLILVSGTPTLAVVFGDTANTNSEVRPTDEEIVAALKADGTWSGSAVLLGLTTISRSGSTMTSTHKTSANDAIVFQRLAQCLLHA